MKVVDKLHDLCRESWMLRWKSFLVPATVALLVGLSPAPVRADVTLDFTDAIDFNYTGGTGNISDLSASVTFHVSGSTLTITVDNTSSTAKIAGVFFNAANAGTFSNVSSQSPAIAPSITANKAAGGFGSFNYELNFTGGNKLLNTSTTATITATFSGTITDADLRVQTASNGNPPQLGSTAGVLDWKPLVGNGGFGSDVVAAVPEPSTIVLALSGLGAMGLVGLRRRCRKDKSTV
jgi:hypothetical protein